MSDTAIVPATPEGRRDAIQRGLDNLLPIIKAAYTARDWEHFGFDTWASYVASFGQLRLPRYERTAAAIELREEGLSQRAIAEVLNVDPMTVNRDLSGVENATPEQITGLDGKTYKAAGAHVSRGPSDTDWYTPPEIVEAARRVMGGIDLDPASSVAANRMLKVDAIYTEADDGLNQPWHGRVWMNPPFNQPTISRFVEKLVNEYKLDHVEAACVLVNNATETEWFHRMLIVCNAFCLVKGRLRFWNPDRLSATPLQGQAVLYFGANVNAFAREFKQFGIVATPV